MMHTIFPRRGFLKATAALAALPALASARQPNATVYAHRGASALRPEHTLASYATGRLVGLTKVRVNPSVASPGRSRRPSGMFADRFT